MRAVITGPTGAIGHALIEEFIRNNDEVLAICRKGSSRISSIPVSNLVKVLELDIDQYDNYIRDNSMIEEKYDVFYHFAWCGTTGEDRNDTDLQSRNIEYALSAVRLASFLGCKTFIGAGSQAEYGRVEGVLKADTPTFPETGYGIAKLCAGQLTGILCKQLGMNHIWTRILSIYGPFDGEKSMIISSLRKMLKGETVSFTKGEQKWDYLYSRDAGYAMYLLASKGKNGKIYVIGSGEVHELKYYIQIMIEKSSTASEIKMGAIPYAPKQVMHLCADITDLHNDTGFVPRVGFEQGIQNTIDYLRNTL